MLALPDEDGRGVLANVVEIREGEMSICQSERRWLYYCPCCKKYWWAYNDGSVSCCVYHAGGCCHFHDREVPRDMVVRWAAEVALRGGQRG